MNQEQAKYLHPQVVANIAQSEADGGIYTKDIKDGETIIFHTSNTKYTLRKAEDGTGDFFIQGNMKYCPTPVRCRVNGSTWGGSMIKVGFIGIDMRLEVYPVGSSDTMPSGITTSSIKSIERVQ